MYSKSFSLLLLKVGVPLLLLGGYFGYSMSDSGPEYLRATLLIVGLGVVVTSLGLFGLFSKRKEGRKESIWTKDVSLPVFGSLFSILGLWAIFDPGVMERLRPDGFRNGLLNLIHEHWGYWLGLAFLALGAYSWVQYMKIRLIHNKLPESN